jgi:hypothetical protein
VSESLLSPVDVFRALKYANLRLRGEARASATFKGTDAERKRHNQLLSEKRKTTVVDRMIRKDVPNAMINEIKAIGDTKALSRKEDENERSCLVIVDGNELKKAVHFMWLSKLLP